MLFARILRIITILSLGAAAFTYITHTPLINGLEPIENAMGIVADMSIVQLGSIPPGISLYLSVETSSCGSWKTSAYQ